jgi:hypothetical protein
VFLDQALDFQAMFEDIIRRPLVEGALGPPECDQIAAHGEARRADSHNPFCCRWLALGSVWTLRAYRGQLYRWYPLRRQWTR